MYRWPTGHLFAQAHTLATRPRQTLRLKPRSRPWRIIEFIQLRKWQVRGHNAAAAILHHAIGRHSADPRRMNKHFWWLPPRFHNLACILSTMNTPVRVWGRRGGRPGQYLGGWQPGGRAAGDCDQGQFPGMGNVCWEERQLLPRVQDAENGMPLALVVKTIRRAALCVPCRPPFLFVEFALQFYSSTICALLLNLAFFLFFHVLFLFNFFFISFSLFASRRRRLFRFCSPILDAEYSRYLKCTVLLLGGSRMHYVK